MTEAKRAFGRTTGGAVLERYALEAAIDLLSRPANVREIRQSLAGR